MVIQNESNSKKCIFGERKKFFVFIMTYKGIKPNPDKY